MDVKIGVETTENGPSKVLGPKCGFGSWYMYLTEEFVFDSSKLKKDA